MLSIESEKSVFQLTTPVSKRLSAERRTGFLDNLAARVDQEKREKEAKSQKRRGSGGVATGGAAGKGAKKKGKSGNSSVPQVLWCSQNFSTKLLYLIHYTDAEKFEEVIF